MSNQAAIGVFDSGVGGLSILAEIRRLLPKENLIYLADSAYCPYGTKPLPAIRARTMAVTGYLSSLGCKAVVVACNSACVAGLCQVREEYSFPIIGVEPAVKPAKAATRNGKIGILATNMTLNGERFTDLLEKYGEGVEVFTQPAPGLVELVEEGRLEDDEVDRLLQQYLTPLLTQKVDTLVLGCTHYPFLRSSIQRIAGPDVRVLDTGEAVAKQTMRKLEENDLLSGQDTPGTETFYTSGDPHLVGEVIRKLWLHDRVEVQKAYIEETRVNAHQEKII